MFSPILATACLVSERKFQNISPGGIVAVVTSAHTAPHVGRPREFDRDMVLAAVVELFWEKGFAATSIGDVVERTGLSKSSLYGAFESKEALYRTALDRYLDDHRAMVDTMLVHGARGLADIDEFFDRIGDQVAETGESRGCLAVNTSTELGTTEPSLVELGAQHRDFLRQGFTAALERAAVSGDFDPRRIATTANVLVSTVLGLAVMVRGGADLGEIRLHLESAKGSLRPG